MAFVGYEIVLLMETESGVIYLVYRVCEDSVQSDLKRLNKFATYCLEQPLYKVSKRRPGSQLPRGRVVWLYA